jgi:hypothetical protein
MDPSAYAKGDYYYYWASTPVSHTDIAGKEERFETGKTRSRGARVAPRPPLVDEEVHGLCLRRRF